MHVIQAQAVLKMIYGRKLALFKWFMADREYSRVAEITFAGILLDTPRSPLFIGSFSCIKITKDARLSGDLSTRRIKPWN